MRKKINKIPILNVICRISNAYVYKGDPIHLVQIAPLKMWCDRIGKGFLFSAIVGVILTILLLNGGSSVSFDPEDAILGIFPDILGFGIGVFALLFALPNEFLRKLKDSVNNANGDSKISGPEMLPADMAYPLLVYSVIMLFSVFFRVLPDEPITTSLSTIFLIYGFVVTLELLSSIFMTASYMLIVRGTDSDSKPDEKL